MVEPLDGAQDGHAFTWRRSVSSEPSSSVDEPPETHVRERAGDVGEHLDHVGDLFVVLEEAPARRVRAHHRDGVAPRGRRSGIRPAQARSIARRRLMRLPRSRRGSTVNHLAVAVDRDLDRRRRARSSGVNASLMGDLSSGLLEEATQQTTASPPRTGITCG